MTDNQDITRDAEIDRLHMALKAHQHEITSLTLEINRLIDDKQDVEKELAAALDEIESLKEDLK